MYRIVLGLVFYLAVFADAAFQNCGSTVGSWTHVTVSTCDADGPLCILKKPNDVSIKIKFNLDRDVDKVKTVIHRVVDGLEMPFPILHNNTCEASGLSCPLTKGGPYEYQRSIHVDSNYPEGEVDVKWELKDENNDVIACVLIPAEVK